MQTVFLDVGSLFFEKYYLRRLFLATIEFIREKMAILNHGQRPDEASQQESVGGPTDVAVVDRIEQAVTTPPNPAAYVCHAKSWPCVHATATTMRPRVMMQNEADG